MAAVGPVETVAAITSRAITAAVATIGLATAIEAGVAAVGPVETAAAITGPAIAAAVIAGPVAETAADMVVAGPAVVAVAVITGLVAVAGAVAIAGLAVAADTAAAAVVDTAAAVVAAAATAIMAAVEVITSEKRNHITAVNDAAPAIERRGRAVNYSPRRRKRCAFLRRTLTDQADMGARLK